VGKFLKTVTYQRMTQTASIEIGKVTNRQCTVERMLAHGLTAQIRIDKYSSTLGTEEGR
jgi:sulfopropanediol 3-dehydrogenase